MRIVELFFISRSGITDALLLLKGVTSNNKKMIDAQVKKLSIVQIFFLLNERNNILSDLREHSGYLSINKTNNNNNM